MSSPCVCVYVENPLVPEAAVGRVVPSGSRIRDLAPDWKFAPICRYGDVWISRADWDRALLPGERVEFYQYAQGGGGGGGSDAGRAILTIAAIYIALQFGQPEALSFLTPAQYAGLVTFVVTNLVNVIIPVDTGSRALGTQNTASSNYNTQLAGNQARLDQAIPVLYGRNKTYPDFASEPYNEYINNLGATTDDQFYNVLLCLGQGSYSIEIMLLDDTPLQNFQEVETEVLPPGSLPTLVKTNVVNAPEVAGSPLPDARYIGPFIACRPTMKTTAIQIDITLSRGLAIYDTSGNPTSKTVGWRVEYRAVDDFGGGLTPWAILATESLTLAQTEPVRRTYTYQMADHSIAAWDAAYRGVPIRPQVRLTRTTPFDPNNRVANTIEWAGLKGFISDPVPLCATATHIAVRMRATDQLTGLSQRKLAVISRRLLKTWNPGTGWSASEVETRNPAWAQANKWTNPVYGDGYPDDRCDLASLYNLSLVWDARQDRFDGVFDQTYDSFTADQMIANSGRAAVFRRNGLVTVARDAKQDMPTTAYTGRNILPGTVKISYGLPNESTPDGVIVEYFDNRVWDWRDITEPLPGVTTPVRAQRMKLFGVTGATHARREAKYQAAQALYRRKFPEFATELEGMIPAFNTVVAFSPSLPGWGAGGDVVSWDAANFTAVLSEPPLWTTATYHYLSFITRDGSLSVPYVVTKGADEFSVVFKVTPSEVLSVDRPDEERTKYLFGAGTPYPSLVRIRSISNSSDEKGVRTFQFSTVIDDDRVHQADNALLPTDGVVQDPVDGGLGIPGTGPGTAYVPYLFGQLFQSFHQTGGTAKVTLTLYNTGVLTELVENIVVIETEQTGAWLLGRPWTPTEGALFEVRATDVDGASGVAGSALDTWLGLGTTRSWSVTAAGAGAVQTVNLLLEIRSAVDGIIQASATYTLYAQSDAGF